MTQPQQDPAADVGAALARLAEQCLGLQRQVGRLEAQAIEREHSHRQTLGDLERRMTELTEAKFVTFDTMLTGQAKQVELALDATEKAIGKAEVATSKAIDKESAANADRRESDNNFRQQLNDQARTFMPRTEALQLVESATQRLRELTELIPTLASRAEVQLMTDRHSERLSEITDRLNRQEGQEKGAKDNKAGLYAALGVGFTLIIVTIAVLNFVTSRN